MQTIVFWLCVGVSTGWVGFKLDYLVYCQIYEKSNKYNAIKTKKKKKK